MATPGKQRQATLDEAVARLQRDPNHPVRARVGELDVEIRVISGGQRDQTGLGDLMAAAGPWEGESTEELIRILREARDAGGSAEPQDPSALASMNPHVSGALSRASSWWPSMASSALPGETPIEAALNASALRSR